MDAFEKEFFSGAEGANKEAVKRLTGAMELEMHKMTVNAPDWWVLEPFHLLIQQGLVPRC
jgi:hypothetical protein